MERSSGRARPIVVSANPRQTGIRSRFLFPDFRAEGSADGAETGTPPSADKVCQASEVRHEQWIVVSFQADCALIEDRGNMRIGGIEVAHTDVKQ